MNIMKELKKRGLEEKLNLKWMSTKKVITKYGTHKYECWLSEGYVLDEEDRNEDNYIAYGKDAEEFLAVVERAYKSNEERYEF